jgi:phosphatidylethanolamine/phosphatidyl-N-methylethanolamine N-methyltransferase
LLYFVVSNSYRGKDRGVANLPGDRKTEVVRRRYDRVAPFYDAVLKHAPILWWQMLWSKVEGESILEVGVGTGMSFQFYPPATEITAVDFSAKMLARARAKAIEGNVKVSLLEMDVQDLKLADNAFDAVAASLVFCSVPHPVLGLTEVRRVCRSGGKVVLLEHVISRNRAAALLMNLLNPLAFWLVGDNINRDTVRDVRESGLKVENVTEFGGGIFRLIEARKN